MQRDPFAFIFAVFLAAETAVGEQPAMAQPQAASAHQEQGLQESTSWSWRVEARLANPGSAGFRCAAVYQDKLYLGTDQDRQPWNAGVYVFDGKAWRLSTDFGGEREAVVSLCVFNNKLYAGVEERGEVWVYDGKTWSVSLDSNENWPLALAVWRGKLWASIASRRTNRLYSFDGQTWTDHGAHDPGTVGFCLNVYNDRLYLGLSGSDYYNRKSTAGRVLAFDGKDWAVASDPDACRVQQIASHGELLFAGVFPEGRIYQFDGKEWGLSHNTPDDTIMAFAPYSVTGHLYAGGEAADENAPGLYEWDGQAWHTVRTFAQAKGRGVVLQEFRGRLYVAIGNGEVWSGLPASAGERLRETGGESQDRYDVVWSTPSKNAAGSMPIGNGDVGLNVWVESNGDLLFYIGKTDAWSENCRLLKLGRLRVRLRPNLSVEGPFFRQTLRLRTAEIVIEAGPPEARSSVEVRVDANHPVVHLRLEGREPFDVRVDLETWRKQRRQLEGPEVHSAYGLDGANPEPVYVEPDTIVPGQKDRVVWYHRNQRSIWADNLRRTDLGDLIGAMKDPLLYHTFGAAIEGTGLVQSGDTSLESAAPAKRFDIAVHVLTSQPRSGQQWLEQLDQQMARVRRLDEGEMRAAHQRWWAAFWERSWIHLSGSPEAEAVSQGYVLQRFVNACGGRGAFPVKFNGSIFNVDDAILVVEPERVPKAYDADYRRWGGPYWLMNTRLIYWPMLASGDFDLMQPFFRMYREALPLARQRTRIYYNHEGVFFPETIYFWGNYATRNYGWKREGLPVGLPSTRAMRYYWSGGLELSAIMLDYYAHTQDEQFLRDALLPLADGVVTFYDQHYPRDAQGQLRISPAHALESYWPVVNPLPEIAGLRFVLGGLLALPQAATTPAQRTTWKRLLAELPPLPTRVVDGQTVLSVAEEVGKMYNLENPNLYAIFPYRLFGVGKQRLELAQLTFAHRVHKGTGGHAQDAIQAACLGLAGEAASDVIRNLTAADPSIRFPAFRGLFPNWIPDQNNGSVAMLALQRMLLQTEGRKILLFPAWPRGWNVDFRLHAPYKTTLEGAYRDAKLVSLAVTPTQRTDDVTVLAPQ